MPNPIPSDDLYARLGVPPDADAPTIDRAWRSLLKRHHPDVAGAVSLEIAKRINVAHDWLSRPELRARYDAARADRSTVPGSAQGAPRRQTAASSRSATAASSRSATAGRRPAAPDRPSAPPDELDLAFGLSAGAVRSFLAQAASLGRDDIDRLSVSDLQPFPASLQRLVPLELWRRVGAIDELLQARLPTEAWADPRTRLAARGYGRAAVLELFLVHALDDSEVLIDDLRRGWESAVGQPRYGPNTDEVTRVIERIGRATPAEAIALASHWHGLRPEATPPWPDEAEPSDYAALQVSAALARRDAAAAGHLDGMVPDAESAARRAFALTAHVTTLRPICSARAYAPYQRAWDAVMHPGRRSPNARVEPTVRRA
ncbi:MAG TPA: J domain-containing protein [Candidatus Saccharimonadales bacterium]|nr:J domain-containing protein [Candidatus Saccharimonadales bacterium]